MKPLFKQGYTFPFEVIEQYRVLGVAMIKTMPKIDSLVWSHSVPTDLSASYNVGVTRKEYKENVTNAAKRLRMDPDLWVDALEFYASSGAEEGLMESHIYMDMAMTQGFPEVVFLDAAAKCMKHGVSPRFHFPEGCDPKGSDEFVGHPWQIDDTRIWNSYAEPPEGYAPELPIHLGWSVGHLTDVFPRGLDGREAWRKFRICTAHPGPARISIGVEYIRAYLYGRLSISQLAESVWDSCLIESNSKRLLDWFDASVRDVEHSMYARLKM